MRDHKGVFMRKLSIRSMPYYCDRGYSASNERCVEVAEKLLQNKILLWGDNVYFEPSAENIFAAVFETDEKVNREYLFAMDYLSNVLSAYKKTNDQRYKNKFLEIVSQFFKYCGSGSLPLSECNDLISCAQTLLFIKSFALISYEALLKEKIVELLYSHAQYCYDDCNHRDTDNHGLFTDLALLHLSVLFDSLPEARKWKEHALARVRKLFDIAFYEDHFNNEGSLLYFYHNLIQYRKILSFCDAYQFSGLESLRDRLEHSEKALRSFARSDGSYPVIGDGCDFSIPSLGADDVSACYPQGGFCVVKTGGVYLTLRCGTVRQDHAHVDDSSVTIRCRALDLALDCGQYDYDRYTPVNRFLRTSGAHSGIFPLFVDGLSLKEYLDRRGGAKIDCFDFDGAKALLSCGYEMDGGAIKVWREITVQPERIAVRDRWECASPRTMRQRFVLPKEMLAVSKFTASKQMFETKVGEQAVQYRITADCPAMTTMNFGVLSEKYFEFEPTVLLDTVAENTLCGEITAVITVRGKEKQNG